MKIVEVETIPLAIPFTHGGKPAGWGGKAWTSLSILLVKATTEAGVTGYGEAFSYNCLRPVQTAFDDMVAPIIVGEEVDDIGIFLGAVQQKLHLFGRYGILMFALSGLVRESLSVRGTRDCCRALQSGNRGRLWVDQVA